MNDKPSSPKPKTYKSNINVYSKYLTLDVTQKIITNIINNEFELALQLCNQCQNVSLKKITDLCYEYFVLKCALSNNHKQDRLLISNKLSQQFKHLLQTTLHYKTFYFNQIKYLQEINAAIKEITISQKFNPKSFSANNQQLQQIKLSLFQAHSCIVKLRLKQKDLNKSIERLNLFCNNSKISWQGQLKEQNKENLRQKLKLTQQIKAKNLKIQQMQEFEKQQSRKILVEFGNLQDQIKQLTSNLNKVFDQKQKLIKQLSQAKIQNSRTVQEIQSLRSSEKKYDKQRKDFLGKIQQKKKTINELLSELEAANQLNVQLQDSERSCQNLVDQLRNKNEELQDHCLNLRNLIQQQKYTSEELKLKVQQQTAQIEGLRTQKDQLTRKCQDLQNEINDNFLISQMQTSNISQLKEQHDELKQNLVNQQTQKYNLHQKIQELEAQIFHYQTANQCLQKRIKQLDTQNDKLNQHINSLNLQLEKLTEEFWLLKTQGSYYPRKSEAEYIDKCFNTLLSLQDLVNIQNKCIDDQQTINKYRQKTEALEVALLRQQKLKDELKQKGAAFQIKYLSLLKQIDLAQIQRTALFFNGRILDQEPQGRSYLQQTIEIAERKKIRKTTLLYQLQNLNKVNVHRYIDNIHNLALVIKTETGWLSGAYTQGPFYPKMISDKNGIIISISGRSFYELRVANKRAIAYDDFFVIFGNSEVRIKTQQYKLFSNFGISSSYYDHKQQKVDVITGQKGVREVTIQGFQFFQVEFY